VESVTGGGGGRNMSMSLEHLMPEARRALLQAGWSAGRSVSVGYWDDRLRELGFTLSPMAHGVIENLGGLTIVPVPIEHPRFTSEKIFFDPFEGEDEVELVDDLQELFGSNFYPIGSWVSHSSLWISDQGELVSFGPAVIWEVGPSIEDALNHMVTSYRPLVALYRRIDRQWRQVDE
jgi:SUKH-3 immunity protein of toxin-antitoxin system